MVQNKPTPEEQLLKLIEGGGNPAPPKAGVSPAVEKSKAESAAGIAKPSSAGLGKIAGFLEHFKGRLFSKSQNTSSTAVMDIKNVNRALAGLVILAVLYLIVDGLFFKAGDSKFMAQVSTSDAVFPMTNAASSMATDLRVYKDNLQRRNPFLPPQVHETTGPANSGAGAAAAGAGSGTMTEMLQAYKLVGISVSDQPLAMIEEVSSGRTFFLRKGQEFKGMKVQTVSREKVTLTYEGQKGDLF